MTSAPLNHTSPTNSSREDPGLLAHLRLDTECPTMQAECCTCVMVAIGSSVAAVLAISDPLKPEARGVVAALHKMGLVCHLLTGDNWRTARAIAEKLGMLNVTAECLPGAKSEKVKVCPSFSIQTWRNSVNVNKNPSSWLPASTRPSFMSTGLRSQAFRNITEG